MAYCPVAEAGTKLLLCKHKKFLVNPKAESIEVMH